MWNPDPRRLQREKQQPKIPEETHFVSEEVEVLPAENGVNPDGTQILKFKGLFQCSRIVALFIITILTACGEAEIKTDHMDGMKGATAEKDSAKKTTVYMVSYKDTDTGEQIDNHKWVTEDELTSIE